MNSHLLSAYAGEQILQLKTSLERVAKAPVIKQVTRSLEIVISSDSGRPFLDETVITFLIFLQLKFP